MMRYAGEMDEETFDLVSFFALLFFHHSSFHEGAPGSQMILQRIPFSILLFCQSFRYPPAYSTIFAGVPKMRISFPVSPSYRDSSKRCFIPCIPSYAERRVCAFCTFLSASN